MTKTVTRYDFMASCNGSHGEDTAWTEIEHIEQPDGEWVRYEDIQHLLAAEHDPIDCLPVCTAKVSADEPACEHDLQKPNHTLTITHDMRPGADYDSVAACRVCEQEFMHPLHSALRADEPKARCGLCQRNIDDPTPCPQPVFCPQRAVRTT